MRPDDADEAEQHRRQGYEDQHREHCDGVEGDELAGGVNRGAVGPVHRSAEEGVDLGLAREALEAGPVSPERRKLRVQGVEGSCSPGELISA